MELLFEHNLPVFDTTDLRAAIAKTEVVSEEKVFRDGIERDAVNTPSKRRINDKKSLAAGPP